ncbi:olfactory receptor 5G9-like [Mixophyes fleayi]|uniref:olfactory receptor 5G9-like n=1 Tax=Mixophyes fleayi TaxID=3061075 RepID=UPI003F4D85BD
MTGSCAVDFPVMAFFKKSYFMDKENQTIVAYFIIKGITDVPELQVSIFILVLLMYLITLGGNMTILLLVCLDHRLHTPMYFFLGNLSIVDMCSSTVTLHNILLIGITGNRAISHQSCIAQIFFFGSFLSNELLFLTAMSYDRYVAICNPLRYTVIMNFRVSALLATVCWLLGFVEIIPYAVLVTGYPCYNSNIVNHFFCDLLAVIKLSCSDTSVLEILFIAEGMVILTLGPLFLTIISYIFIIVTILRIRTSIGRRKAFYTCSSHLTVVLLLYTTLIGQYMRPVTTDSLEYNKLFALFNTVAVPILNPIIYSLKNKDVKSAVQQKLCFFKLHSSSDLIKSKDAGNNQLNPNTGKLATEFKTTEAAPGNQSCKNRDSSDTASKGKIKSSHKPPLS